jgi:hypothetical protein
MDTPFKNEGAAESHTRLRTFSPILPVRDLRQALAHYASLGFEVTPYADGDYYGFADRDGVSLHLSREAGHDHEGEHDHEHVGNAYLYVADADALYDEWARPGAGRLTHRARRCPPRGRGPAAGSGASVGPVDMALLGLARVADA